MPAEHVVVRERVPEEVGSLESLGDRGVLVLVAHERGDAGHLRVDRVTDRDALVRERRVVVVDPHPRFLGVDERERQRADPLLRGEVDGVAPAAGDPDRWVRELARLGHDVAGGIVTYSPA